MQLSDRRRSARPRPARQPTDGSGFAAELLPRPRVTVSAARGARSRSTRRRSPCRRTSGKSVRCATSVANSATSSPRSLLLGEPLGEGQGRRHAASVPIRFAQRLSGADDRGMPLTGEYEPSTSKWARDQAERFEATDGAEANTLPGQADHRADLGRREEREAAQDRADARGARRPLRRRRVEGRRARAPGLVLEPREAPARRAAGRRGRARTTTPGCSRATSARPGGSAPSRRGPTTRAYQTKTDREIPVFLLEPR